ncbi:MAG: tRNA pseudouridine(55) synthase TruB [Pirellulaceae bacterium]|nr:tRNA pseudouridine(55) synthase TruB [Pirellulaceae bacterium]
MTDLFGFLNCDKPPGITSRDVVNVVQRRLRPAKIKVGHCGTLDPLAEGVLVIGVGAAVRLVPYVQQQPKQYRGKFRLGASSETGDLEKGFTEHPDLPTPSLDQLQSARQSLIGLIQQVPPAYSAIWVDGQRAYERVRRGEDVEMPSRQVMIHDLQIVSMNYPEFELDIVCGSGTYIRTLGIDLARAVGSTAVMTHLKRTGVGDFSIESAVTIDQLRDAPLEPLLFPPIRAVSHLPRLVVDEDGSQRLANGLCVEGTPSGDVNEQSDVAAVNEVGELRAILRRKSRGWCPYRVFPLPT